MNREQAEKAIEQAKVLENYVPSAKLEYCHGFLEGSAQLDEALDLLMEFKKFVAPPIAWPTESGLFLVKINKFLQKHNRGEGE